MKNIIFNHSAVFIFGVFIFVSVLWSDVARAESDAKNQLVALVDRAAELVESIGEEKACENFKQPGSEWFHDDTYVFINDMKGVVVCHPANPEFEGANMLSLQNSDGTFVVQKLIDAVRTKTSAWVEYMWPKPSEGKDAKKLTYVKRVDSGKKALVVASGIYLD